MQYRYSVALVEVPQLRVGLRLIRVAPFLGDVLLKVAGEVWAKTVMDKFLLAERAAASVTLTVKFTVPDVVGVPDINPVDVFKVNPPGSEPDDTAHVVDPEAPEALNI